MAKFTLLEVHLDDASFTANAPFSGSDETDESEADGSDGETAAGGDEESGGRRRLLGVLLAVAVFALAYFATRKLGGGEEPEVDLEDFED